MRSPDGGTWTLECGWRDAMEIYNALTDATARAKGHEAPPLHADFSRPFVPLDDDDGDEP